MCAHLSPISSSLCPRIGRMVLCLALLWSVTTTADESSRTGNAIAILPLHVEGDWAADEIESLTYELGAQLFNVAIINVIAPERVQQAVSDQNVGDVCASSCAYAIGTTLDAAYVFSGVLTAKGDSCAIAGTVYDIAKRRPAALVKHAGTRETSALLSLAEKNARELAEAIGLKLRVASPPTANTVRRLPAPIVKPTLSPATLVVASTPSGAEVVINQTVIGVTPCTIEPLRPGRYEVEVAKADYDSYTRTLTLSAGTRTHLRAPLVPRLGGLTVLSTPSGADVVVNEKELGNTPYTAARLLPGNYAVDVVLDGYVRQSSLMTLRQGEHDTLRVRLHSADSLAAASSRARKRNQWIRRVVFGSCGVVFALAGLNANEDVERYVVDMDEAVRRYNQDGQTESAYERYLTQYNNAHEKAEIAADSRNVMYSIAGAFAIGFAISIGF